MGLALLAMVSTLALVAGTNAHVLWVSRGRRHATVANVPPRAVGLVLGCAPRSSTGGANCYFVARVQAAAALYNAGKIDWLLVSGGLGEGRESEAIAMRNGLVSLGVPHSRVWCDDQGARTWASLKRARTEHDIRSVVIVSQAFHTPRAVYLALSLNIDAHALNAEAPGPLSGVQLRLELREVVARSRALFDVWSDGLR